MSANGGLKLFSLNNEHCIPGNQNEEERIIEMLTKKSGLKNLKPGSQESKQAQNDLTEFICQMKMPFTRMLGFLEPPKTPTPQKLASPVTLKNYETFNKIQHMTISSEPEITAMQITTEEDFMIISSSGIFEKLQGIDLMNIIWQQALMEAQKTKHTDI